MTRTRQCKVSAHAAESGYDGESRYLITGREAARKIGVSYRHWLRLCDGGLAPWGIKLRSLRRWDVVELDRWIFDGCPAVRSVKGGK